MTTALTIVALTFARCGTPFSVQAIYYEKAAQLEFGLPRYMVPAVWYFVASGHTVSQDLPGMARHVYLGLLSEYLALTAHGMRNELSLGLKWLDIPVQGARLLLRRGEIELGESSSSRQSLAHAPRPPYSYCKEEAS